MSLVMPDTWAGIEGPMPPPIPGHRVHFIGVGGIGMSALAHVLCFHNYAVSGSDLVENRLTAQLARLGARIYLGHAASHVDAADLVVVSSAVRQDNVEYLRALERGLPIWHRARVLGALLAGHRAVVVAGTHGKTTTTSMLATLAHQAGMDPTLIIGGELPELGGNARVGKSNLIIAEGDESDGSLVELSATYALINSIDMDHLDYFHDLSEIEALFERFARGVHPSGEVWISADWEGCRRLAEKRPHPEVRLYGLHASAELTAEGVELLPGGSRFTLVEHGSPRCELQLSVPGMHNVHNALGAAGVARALGLSWPEIAAGLAAFAGVGRRFEFVGQAAGVRVLDDYAHHPAEILATLRALSGATTGRKIGVFQPHRYTRTQALFAEFGAAFPVLDHLFLTEIYSAGEPPIPGVTGEALAEEVRRHRSNVEYAPDWQALPDILADFCRPGDTVITLGAGSVNRIGPQLLSILRRREGTA